MVQFSTDGGFYVTSCHDGRAALAHFIFCATFIWFRIAAGKNAIEKH
jgi:hypothetical protein